MKYKWTVHIAACCFLYVCTGCVSDYTLPPDYFRESLSVFSTGPAAHADIPVPDTVDIHTCIRLVVKNSPEILSSVADSVIAEESVTSAMSYLVPKITLEANHTYSRFDMIEYSNPDTGNAPDELTTARLSTRYLLYDFGRARALVSQRYADTDAARARVRTVTDRMVISAVTLFYSVRAMEEDLLIITASIDSLAARLRDAENFFAQGIRSESSVLTVRAALEDLKYRKAALENMQFKTMIQLKRMMGIPLKAEISLAGERNARSFDIDLDLGICIDAAFSVRPEIKAARAVIVSARHGIDAAKAGRWPLFLISAEISYTDIEWMLHEGYTVRGNVSMQWDLFDAGETRSAVRIEREKLRKARLQLKRVSDTVMQEVMTALADIRELKRQQIALHTAIESARRNVEEMQSLFRNKKATAAEVVEAERQLLESRSNLNKAAYAFSRALYELERSTGTSVEGLVSRCAAPPKGTGTEKVEQNSSGQTKE